MSDMPAPAAESARIGGAPPRVVLFEFGGVLVRGDVFAAFIRDRYARAWWRAGLLLPLLPLFAVLAPTRRGRRVVAHCAASCALLGIGAVRYRALAECFGRELARDARNLSRSALGALNTHRLAGDRVLVVTVCEETLVRAMLDELGFGAIELIASRLAPARCGMRVGLHNRGVAKAQQLARHGARAPWDIVYSGSLEDLPILAAARAAVLVNPDRRTLARVSARLGRRLGVVDWR